MTTTGATLRSKISHDLCSTNSREMLKRNRIFHKDEFDLSHGNSLKRIKTNDLVTLRAFCILLNLQLQPRLHKSIGPTY